MKKTMFITSVIMVLVLAVALTTSSLAWFQATNGAKTVSATAISVTAKVAEATNGGLVISTSGTTGTWKTSDQNLTAVSNTLSGHYPTAIISDLTNADNYKPLLSSNAPSFTAADIAMDESANLVAKVVQSPSWYSGYVYVGNAATTRSSTQATVSIMVQGALYTAEGNEHDWVDATYRNMNLPNVNVMVLAQPNVEGEAGAVSLGNASIVYLGAFSAKDGSVQNGKVMGAYGSNEEIAGGFKVGDIMDTSANGKLKLLKDIPAQNLPEMAQMGMDQYEPYQKDAVRLTMYVWFDGQLLTAEASKNLDTVLKRSGGNGGIAVSMSISDAQA